MLPAACMHDFYVIVSNTTSGAQYYDKKGKSDQPYVLTLQDIEEESLHFQEFKAWLKELRKEVSEGKLCIFHVIFIMFTFFPS